MKHTTFIRTAPVTLAASAAVLLALCGCAGRTASDMKPKGITVEVNPMAPTAPADTVTAESK
ncbi:MAG: hypothetical protein K2J92_01795 [Muribaculaceae bacterium]|nr:hypothetical protein [Bacteroides sp.]MDE6680067.1 hypothetical protein [Muribaculaceae bacterium]MDE6803233.1 hypothetical protein [Muribaculaceae bacterium]MDE6842539.1 hypothetical protein [Muribaculaceae bacterium]MDE7190796.1 hypothetical protein [Muribaculaceae bacterium]